jgi:hypothetical protein
MPPSTHYPVFSSGVHLEQTYLKTILSLQLLLFILYPSNPDI